MIFTRSIETLNKIKTDLISIRADISIIKDFIQREERKNEENKKFQKVGFGIIDLG
jgi:hypothetical protein